MAGATFKHVTQEIAKEYKRDFDFFRNQLDKFKGKISVSQRG